MTPTNTVTARRETREVEIVVKQKQDLVVLEMPLEVAMTLKSAVGRVGSFGPRRAMMSNVFTALTDGGVFHAYCFTGKLYEIQ